MIKRDTQLEICCHLQASNLSVVVRKKEARKWFIACKLRLYLTTLIISFFTCFSTHAQDVSPLEILVIVSGEQRHTFEVEVVRDDAGRMRGLMYRKHLPASRGMLFDFKNDQSISMWMQNTYISLDMLFIQANGVISHIVENTEPLSTRLISSNGVVRGVLEINAGVVKSLQIKVGDRITQPLFDTK